MAWIKCDRFCIIALSLCSVFHNQLEANTTPSIARIFIDPAHRVHIVHTDGREITAPKEKDQVSVTSSAVAENKLYAGWLIEFENCCTSYPVPLKLVIYAPGRPLKGFGNGMMIASWHFEAGGKQVAFSTNTVHGDLAPHYELRDTRTGRLISSWDGHLTGKSPAWAGRLK